MKEIIEILRDPFWQFVGAAFALIPFLIPVMRRIKRRRVEIIDPDFLMHSLKYEFWVFKFRATLVNLADATDVLLEIRHCFYHRKEGFIESTMVSGAGPIVPQGDIRGHVLPVPIESNVNMQVEGDGNFRMDGITYDPSSNDDFVLRCKFIFARSKPLIVRVSPRQQLTKRESRLARILEARFCSVRQA